MSLNAVTWVSIGLHGVSLLITALILPMYFRIRKLQDNEIAHVGEGLKRIEDKLDSHIEWHLEHRP